MDIPQYTEMFNPLIKALHELGGSGSIDEINAKVGEIEKYPDDMLEVLHGTGPRSEVEYRLAWARTYLKKFGILENSSRGVWSIATDKNSILEVNPKEVVDFFHAQIATTNQDSSDNNTDTTALPTNDEHTKTWQENLIELIQSLPPDNFERLIQRVLREAGFSQVEVTGKTGDGGIDGKGIFKIAGLISFNVLFQCKRWKNAVTASDIRDFRGAMQGRADKGLFATTSTFTRDASKEASRDGATPIDLLDGEALTNKIRELKLGIKIEYVENVSIDEKWFKSI
jgi:restriction system protein